MFHRIEAQAIRLGPIHHPSGRSVQEILHIFPIKSGVGGQHLCRNAISRSETDVGPVRQVAVIFGIVRLPNELNLGKSRAFRRAKVLIGRARLLRQVDQIGKVTMLDLPGIVPVRDVIPFPIEPFLGQTEMEILRHQSGISVDRSRGVISGNVKRVVIHDVVEVNANPKAMRDFDEANQVRFRSIARADRAALILAAEIKSIPQIIANGKAATSFGRRREPERIVTGLGQLRHFQGDFVPVGIEILEHRFAAGGRRLQKTEKQRG